MNTLEIFECEMLHASVVLETAKTNFSHVQDPVELHSIYNGACGRFSTCVRAMASVKRNEEFDEDAFMAARNELISDIQKIVALMPDS